jgi:L-ascorbate metabolism protein UlaG (beta-lactamase superfamily)
MHDTHPRPRDVQAAPLEQGLGMELIATHVGTATVLLELAGVRILTDPVLGAPHDHHFGFGMRSRHLRAPALSRAALPPLDLVLLSHDQHGDNLDEEGRALLESVPHLVTTKVAARRLGLGTGLADFEVTTVDVRGVRVRITATPARHGPPLSLPMVGAVIGFLVEVEGMAAPLYLSGDTVYFGGLERLAERTRIGTAFLHMGGAGYLGLRFTMDAREAARAAQRLGAAQVVPLHYDDWTHFKDPVSNIAPAFAAAGLSERLRWLDKGVATTLTV